MAQFTRVGTVDMRGAFAACGYAIMTTNAIGYEGAVVDRDHGDPSSHCMTGIALEGRCDMGGTLAGGDDIVMATTAHPDHFVMVHGVVG